MSRSEMNESRESFDAAWFARVLDAMDDLVLVKGPRSRLLWANRAFRRCYGMSNEELRSLIDGQQSDPDDTLQYVRDDRRVFVERTSIDVPSEAVTDHLGRILFFHTKKSPIFDDRGEVAMQVGVSRARTDDDPLVSSRYLREQGHASTRNVRALVRALPAPVVMLDAACRIIMWNDAFERVVDDVGAHDGPPSELMHADYEEVLEPSLPLLDEFDAIIQGGKPTGRALEVVGADGLRRAFSVNCQTWTDASDVVSGTLALFHDITEMLANERRLREANQELAQFNYRVSHDVVAPVSTARGCIEFAIDELGEPDTADPAELMELLVDARNQLDRLDMLVADLSSLARANAEARIREPVYLAEIVDMLRADGRVTGKAGIVIDTDLELDEFRSDPRRIRQILLNLIDNAMKYRDPEESEPRVTVCSRREGEAIVIEVRDNGRGIDPELGEKAFEMFTRGGSSASSSGLGLYIVARHVDRLGGALSIARHAKPTVIRIVLPGSRRAAA